MKIDINLLMNEGKSLEDILNMVTAEYENAEAKLKENTIKKEQIAFAQKIIDSLTDYLTKFYPNIEMQNALSAEEIVNLIDSSITVVDLYTNCDPLAKFLESHGL